MRTKQYVGFTTTIDILRGTMSADVAANRYDLLKTFGVGHDVPARDWRDYLLQMLQMGFIEIAYTEDKHLKVTELGREALFGDKKVELAMIRREDRRKKKIKQEQQELPMQYSNAGKTEDPELFRVLRKLRQNIAEENNWPAYVVMSDKTLHALATEKPTTLNAFSNIYGIGEYKLKTYGKRFVDVIKDYLNS